MREALVQLGERIRVHRRRKKWTQTELAKEIGYSMNGIAKIERGESDPKFSALTKIADALEVELVELLAGNKEYIFSVSSTNPDEMADFMRKFRIFFEEWEMTQKNEK